MAPNIPPGIPDIFIAASTNDVKALRIAIPHYGINAQDENLLTPLHHAAADLAFDAVEVIMAHPDVDPTMVDKFDRTASYIPFDVHGECEDAARMSARLRPYCYLDMDEELQLKIIPGGKRDGDPSVSDKPRLTFIQGGKPPVFPGP